jgi:PAS domain S-box-containing protein
MQMSALLRYDPLWFAATLILAGLTCVLGLGLEVRLRGANRIPAWLGSTLSAAVIAAAISLIHFVGMASARFVGTPDPDYVADSGASTGMALGIAGVVIVFGLLIGGLHSLSRFRALALRARADEERMRAILDTAVDAILTADSAGRIQNFNRGAERLFGWRAEEVLGRTLRMLIPPALQPRLLAEFQQLLDSGEPRELGEDESLHALTRSGELRPIRLSLGRAAVPGRPLFVAFVRDLSERQALSESLREQELQTRTLIANLPGVAFRCRNDVQWSMLFVSDGIEALTGWSAAAFLDQPSRRRGALPCRGRGGPGRGPPLGRAGVPHPPPRRQRVLGFGDFARRARCAGRAAVDRRGDLRYHRKQAPQGRTRQPGGRGRPRTCAGRVRYGRPHPPRQPEFSRPHRLHPG